MKVLLRHLRTGYHYNGNCDWVAEAASATDFQNIEGALQAIIRDRLDGMSLVISNDENGPEQVFDLSCDVPEMSEVTSS